MNDLVTNAQRYMKTAHREAKAHQISAEYHRHHDMVFGTITTVVTAVVGTSIFAGLVSKLNVAGTGGVQISSGMAWVVALVSIVAPALTAVRALLHDAKDADEHKSGMDHYNHLGRRLDSFCLRFADGGSAGERRDEALREWEDIMKDYDKVPQMPTVTKEAYKAADAEIDKESGLST